MNLFTEYHDYLLKFVDNMIDQEIFYLTQQGIVETKNQYILQNIELMVPFPRKQGHQLLFKLKKQLKITLPEYIETIINLKVPSCRPNIQ